MDRVVAIEQFHQQGFWLSKRWLSAEGCRAAGRFRRRVEESRQHSGCGAQPWTVGRVSTSKRSRALSSVLRRVRFPTEISAAYRHAALDSDGGDCRPADRRQRDPLPSQQNQLQAAAHRHAGEMAPGFSGYPLTAMTTSSPPLLMVSEVTPENGPLNVVPGKPSRTAVVPLANDRFTAPWIGRLSDPLPAAAGLFWPAGSVCFMHTFVCSTPPAQ